MCVSSEGLIRSCNIIKGTTTPTKIDNIVVQTLWCITMLYLIEKGSDVRH